MLTVSIETTNPSAESIKEPKIEEVVTLIEKIDLERMQKLVKVCGIDLIYLGENENPEDGAPNYQNLIISELPQTSEEELTKAARVYSKNLNSGIYKAKDSDNAIRAKQQKENNSAPMFVSIKTSNEDITFDDFNLLFFVLREKGSDNINNKLQMEKSIYSKYLKNKAEKKRREKELRDSHKHDIKAPINNLIEVASEIVEDEEDPGDVIVPTIEELEGKI